MPSLNRTTSNQQANQQYDSKAVNYRSLGTKHLVMTPVFEMFLRAVMNGRSDPHRPPPFNSWMRKRNYNTRGCFNPRVARISESICTEKTIPRVVPLSLSGSETGFTKLPTCAHSVPLGDILTITETAANFRLGNEFPKSAKTKTTCRNSR